MFIKDNKRVAEESTFNNRVEQFVKKVTPTEEVNAQESVKPHWWL